MHEIDLSGPWECVLGYGSHGAYQSAGRFFREFSETGDILHLPGSTDLSGLGTEDNGPDRGHLTRRRTFLGRAWIEREIDLPSSMADRELELSLERVHRRSWLFIDQKPYGTRDSLVTPHGYRIGKLEAGRHRIVIGLSNEPDIDIGEWACAVTEESQTNWLGIVGNLRLTSQGPIRIGFPTVRYRPIGIEVECRVDFDPLGAGSTGARITCRLFAGGDCLVTGTESLDGPGIGPVRRILLPVPRTVRRWSERDPFLHRLDIQCFDGTETQATCFAIGFRHPSGEGGVLRLDGRRIFLRGAVEDATFPRTGTPYMTPEEWGRILDVYRSYGFNHIRFHSWCPPEAAFEAADRVGLLLQVECPLWEPYGRVGDDPVRAAFIRSEAHRILDHYGHHPSFLVLSLGNELGDGRDPFLASLASELRERETGVLVTRTTHPMVQGDDIHISATGPAGQLVRGHGNRFPGTDDDYRDSLGQPDRPVISHEIGQISSFVDLRSETKFSGVLHPAYFKRYRRNLERHGLLPMAEAFFRESAVWQRDLYKSEIESALRTNRLSGFQLLGLRDSPGWGNASIGVLDVFLEDKGFTPPSFHRMYCDSLVVLCRYPDAVLTSGQDAGFRFQVFNYSGESLSGPLHWQLRSDTFALEGSRWLESVPDGGLSEEFPATIPIPMFPEARKAVLEAEFQGKRNRWDLWLFPPDPTAETAWPDALASSGSILVRDQWDDTLGQDLENGATLLLMGRFPLGRYVERGAYRPIFWSYMLFREQMHAHGLLIDRDHPIFRHVPTDRHTNGLWFRMMNASRLINLAPLGTVPDPIVRGIPSFDLGWNLAMIFEAAVGKGRLFVCGIDLLSLSLHSEANALLRGIREYLESDRFNPRIRLDASMLSTLFLTGRDEAPSEGSGLFDKGFA